MERIDEIISRCKAIGDTPEYQRNAGKLSAEWSGYQKHAQESDRVYRRTMAGIPSCWWGKLEAPEDRPALIEVRALLDGPPERCFVVLAGPKGRGKSFAGAWAVDQKGGRFIDAQEAVDAGAFDRAFWDGLQDSTILTIDELGAEYLNESYLSKLYALLDRRYREQRKTILITNQDAQPFRQRYLSAGLSRLLDRIATAGDWKTFKGESMRRHWQETESDQ